MQNFSPRLLKTLRYRLNSLLGYPLNTLPIVSKKAPIFRDDWMSEGQQVHGARLPYRKSMGIMKFYAGGYGIKAYDVVEA